MMHFCDKVIFSHQNKRQENQDVCGCMIYEGAPDHAGPKASVLYVADGVSNANGGEAAARIGKAARKLMAQLLIDCYSLAEMEETERSWEIFQLLRDVITQLDRGLRPMDAYCATISIALVLGSFVYTANLGDSPIFLVQLDDCDEPEKLAELYACQNRAGEAVAEGRMSKEEALTSSLKNCLSVKVLGQNPDPDGIHTAQTGLGQNNLLLLGSDGALSVLPEAEMLRLIGENTDNGLAAVNQALFCAVQAVETASDNYTLLGQWIRTS